MNYYAWLEVILWRKRGQEETQWREDRCCGICRLYIKWHLACKDDDHLIDVWFFIDLDSFDLKVVRIEAFVCVLVIIRLYVL